MISRRKILGGLALSAIPVGSAAAVAAISLKTEGKTEIMLPSLEQRLAAMDPTRRAEYHACALAKAMKELNPGAWDVKFDTHRDGPRCVLIMQRA